MATITKTIGSAAGRDYSTIQAFIDSIPADLVAAGFCYTGLVYNDSEFNDTTGKVNIASKNTDSTHFITLQCAPGQSFSTNPNRANNALWYSQANGVAIHAILNSSTTFNIAVPYTVIDGFQINATGTGAIAITANATGVMVKNCLFAGQPASSIAYGLTQVAGGATMQDCLVLVTASGAGAGIKMTNGTVINCTVAKPPQFSLGASEKSQAISFNYGTNVVKNCALFGFANQDATPNSYSASDYNATDWNQAPGGTAATHNLLSLVYANQFVNNANDFRLKAGSDLIGKAINLSATYQTTDIIGTARQTNWDIGAYAAITPANALSLSGPTLGQVNQVSSNFTVAANGQVSGSVTVTPSDGGKGGTFNPSSFTMTGVSPSVTFTYTPSQTGNINISISNNGTLANPAAITYNSVLPATQVMLSGPALARAGVQSANFTAQLDGYVATAVKVIPNDNGDGGTFTPVFVMLDSNTPSATFTYTGASGGVKTIATTNDSSLTNHSVSITEKPPIVPVPTPSTPTLVVKSIGTGKDFATIKAFTDFAAAFDLTANQQSLLGEVYESSTVSAQSSFSAKNPTSQFNVTLQPVPGTSANYLDKGYPADYGTEGIELTISNQWLVGAGTVLQDFRFNTTGSSGCITMGGGNSLFYPVFQRNRVKASGTAITSVWAGQYVGPGVVTDCLFILDDGSTSTALNGQQAKLTCKRNTFVRKGSASGYLLSFNANQTPSLGTIIANNVFINAGNTPVNYLNLVAAANVYNNYTDNGQASPIAGITTVLAGSGTNLVRNTTSDFRPDDAGALIGHASEGAIDMLDLYSVGRGGTPDVGAIQGTVINVLPVVAISAQDVNCQRIVVTGTTRYTPTSGTALLLPDPNNPNGAVQQGPTNVVLSAGAFSVQWDNVPAGNYLTPVVTLVNSSGYNRVQTGGDVINIIPVSAAIVAAEASPTQGNAPVITFDNRRGFDNNTFNIGGTVDTQGDPNCSIKVYVDFADSSKASLGPWTANIVGKRWSAQFTGLSGVFSVRAVGTANNQPAVTVNSNSFKVINYKGNFKVPLSW
jgi:hypothetical protein